MGAREKQRKHEAKKKNDSKELLRAKRNNDCNEHIQTNSDT